jgi:hypothetical protein
MMSAYRMMSVYLCYDCHTFIMSVQLHNLCLPILCLALDTCTLDVWPPLRNDVLPPVCHPTCMISGFLYDVCSIQCLHPVLYLPSCIISVQLNDICSTIWCLPACMMSAQLYDVCLPVWCLPSCMISSYPYDVCSTGSCLPTCLMFAQLNDVCLPVWCLP